PWWRSSPLSSPHPSLDCAAHVRTRASQPAARRLDRSGGETFVAHELGAERALGFVLVVGAAAEPDVVHADSAAPRVGIDMIELQVCCRLAPVAVVAHERALATVALPDRALDL